MLRYIAIATAIILASASWAEADTSLGAAGLSLSGDLSVTFRSIDRHTDINRNFRKDDPFNTLRVRLFLTRAWTERASMIVELLMDDMAPVRVNGAYFIFYRIIGPVNAKLGMFGSPFGNFAYRSTYFNQNPVIGIPAIWHYKTQLSGIGNQTNSILIGSRSATNKGLPLLYDACWDTGISLFTTSGLWEAEVSVTQGSLSNPRAYDNDGYQGIAKLGINPATGVRLGVSGAVAPWLSPDATVNLPGPLESYYQDAVGEYAEVEMGHWQFNQEALLMRWELPLLHEGRLTAGGGFVEARWNFSPGWFTGARFDALTFGRIAVNDDGSGGEAAWGYDFNRLELSLGRRIIREGMVRLNYQHTEFRAAEVDPVRLAAVQVFFAF